MLAAIKIQPNMSCDYICHHIQKALSQYQKNNNSDMNDIILVIDIKTTIHNDDFIPKLEHKISQP